MIKFTFVETPKLGQCPKSNKSLNICSRTNRAWKLIKLLELSNSVKTKLDRVTSQSKKSRIQKSKKSNLT